MKAVKADAVYSNNEGAVRDGVPPFRHFGWVGVWWRLITPTYHTAVCPIRGNI